MKDLPDKIFSVCRAVLYFSPFKPGWEKNIKERKGNARQYKIP
jgi:hypothetical protein